MSGYMPGYLRMMHVFKNIMMVPFHYGAHAQEERDYKRFQEFNIFNVKLAKTSLVEYLKSQYGSWMINKVVINIYNVDANVHILATAAAGGGIDKDSRMPKNWGSGTNNYYLLDRRLKDTNLYLRFKMCKNVKDKTDNSLEFGTVEYFDIVFPKDKPNTKKKFLQYRFYPKCTLPITTNELFDSSTKLDEHIDKMKPKNFNKDFSQVLLVGWGPYEASMLPDSNDETNCTDIDIAFEYSIKVYFSLYQRDSTVI